MKMDLGMLEASYAQIMARYKEAESRIRNSYECVEESDVLGWTSKYWEAIDECDPKLIDKYLRTSPIREAVDIKRPNGNQGSPLHELCRNNKRHVIAGVKIIIKHGTKCINQHADRSPLHFASGNGNLELVKLLVENGAIQSVDFNNLYPIDFAMYYGHVEVVKYWIDVNSISYPMFRIEPPMGTTPFHFLICDTEMELDPFYEEIWKDKNRSTSQMVKFLLNLMDRFNLNWLYIADARGQIPIEVAMTNNELEIVKIFLRRSPYEISAANLTLISNGYCPFYRTMPMINLLAACSSQPNKYMPESLRLRIRRDVYFEPSLTEYLLDLL